MPKVDTKGKMKKAARISAANVEKRRLEEQRNAAQQRDLLAKYSAFKKFERSDVCASLEGLRGEDLSEADVLACLNLQKENCDNCDDFDLETSRAALVHPESRVLLMKALTKEDRMPPAVTPSDEEASDTQWKPSTSEDEDWDLVPEVAHLVRHAEAGKPVAAVEKQQMPAESAEEEQEAQPILGYLHLQFCVSNGPPLLCVLNMQLMPSVRGKGLGKFALQLVELMARQLSMELVMLYVKDGKVTTMRLSKHRIAAAHAAADAAADAEPSDRDQAPIDFVEEGEGFELISAPPQMLTSVGGRQVSVEC